MLNSFTNIYRSDAYNGYISRLKEMLCGGCGVSEDVSETEHLNEQAGKYSYRFNDINDYVIYKEHDSEIKNFYNSDNSDGYHSPYLYYLLGYSLYHSIYDNIPDGKKKYKIDIIEPAIYQYVYINICNDPLYKINKRNTIRKHITQYKKHRGIYSYVTDSFLLNKFNIKEKITEF